MLFRQEQIRHFVGHDLIWIANHREDDHDDRQHQENAAHHAAPNRFLAIARARAESGEERNPAQNHAGRVQHAAEPSGIQPFIRPEPPAGGRAQIEESLHLRPRQIITVVRAGHRGHDTD